MRRLLGRAGLRGQLLFYSIAIVILALALVWAGTRLAFQRTFQSYRAEVVGLQAAATADAAAALLEREQGVLSEMSLRHLAGITSTRIRWLDPAGRVRIDTGVWPGAPGPRRGMGMGLERRAGGAGTPERVEGPAVARALPGDLGEVEVRPVGIQGVLQPADVAFQAELNRSMLLAAAASLALAALAALAGARVVGRPIERMRDAVRTLPEEIPDPLPEEGPREVRELARGINAMSRRLHLLDSLRRKSLGEVAHQLRTPLAALRGYLAAIRDRVLPADEAVAEMDRAVTRLDRLATELGRLNRADRMELGLDPGSVEWDRFVVGLGRTWSPAAGRAGLRLEVEAAPTGRVECDPEAIAEAAGNLVENALRYTPRGGRVLLRAGGDPSWVWLDVADTGPGIPAEEQPLVFERFFRGRAAQEEPDGTGIGLAIARQLVTAHGGQIELESLPGRGSRFRIRLPRRPAPPVSGKEPGVTPDRARPASGGR